MAAKRVSVILGEVIEVMKSQASRPVEWRFELVAGPDSVRRPGLTSDSSHVFEAYSARDAHDVECALREMGCLGCVASEDVSLNFIWIERTTVASDQGRSTDPVSLPRR
jgi:hypothetical protein